MGCASSSPAAKPSAVYIPPQPSPVAEKFEDPLAGNRTYTTASCLARRANGYIMLATENATGEQVAIKLVGRGGSEVKYLEREIMNHSLAQGHPHIVQLRDVFLTDMHLAIVIDYCPGGDLADFISAHKRGGKRRALPEPVARAFFQQLITALDFCHRVGIANRDIKLENCLLDGNHDAPLLRLCDFGHSKDQLGDSMCKTLCGTPEYVAPEVLLYAKYDGKSADIWSCGVMLYTMLTGYFPFWGPEEHDEEVDPITRMQLMCPRIVKADFEMPAWLSLDCKALLTALLAPDPAKRITIAEIMRNRWFTKDIPPGLLDVNRRLLELPPESRKSLCRITSIDMDAMVQEGSHKARLSGDKWPTRRKSSEHGFKHRHSNDSVQLEKPQDTARMYSPQQHQQQHQGRRTSGGAHRPPKVPDAGVEEYYHQMTPKRPSRTNGGVANMPEVKSARGGGSNVAYSVVEDRRRSSVGGQSHQSQAEFIGSQTSGDLGGAAQQSGLVLTPEQILMAEKSGISVNAPAAVVSGGSRESWPEANTTSQQVFLREDSRTAMPGPPTPEVFPVRDSQTGTVYWAPASELPRIPDGAVISPAGHYFQDEQRRASISGPLVELPQSNGGLGGGIFREEERRASMGAPVPMVRGGSKLSGAALVRGMPGWELAASNNMPLQTLPSNYRASRSNFTR